MKKERLRLHGQPQPRNIHFGQTTSPNRPIAQPIPTHLESPAGPGRGRGRADLARVGRQTHRFEEGITVIAAVAAWSARETHGVPLEALGEKDAVPVPREEFDRLRSEVR